MRWFRPLNSAYYRVVDIITATFARHVRPVPSHNAGSDIRLSLPLRKFRSWRISAAGRALVEGQQLVAVAAAPPPRRHLHALALGEQRFELVP